MKKLLIVTDFYLPHQSGITTYIENTLKIIKNKFEVTILTGNYSGKLKRFEQIDNIKIIRSKISFNISRGFYSLNLLKDFFIESKKADYINVHFPLTEIFPLIFLSRKPIFLTYHCLPNSNSFSSKIIFLYFYFFGIAASLISKKIIVFTKDYYYSFIFHNFFIKKVIEILPFVETNSTKTPQIIKTDTNIIKVGFLGRLSEEKGLKNLIQASSIMINNKINHLIYIAGDLKDSRFQNNINHLLKISKDNKNIIFLGKLSEEKKQNFFNLIDILVLPSINSFEAFGLVQLEAMSYGKPVIASNLNGVRIPIKYTGNGLLFDKWDIHELVKCIEFYSNNKSKVKKKLIKNSLNKYFSKSNFQKLFLSLFE